MKRFIKMTLLTILGVGLLIAIALSIFFNTAPQIGRVTEGVRLQRMKQSENYVKDKFQNTIATNMDMPVGDVLSSAWQILKGGKERDPETVIKTIPFNKETFLNASDSEVVISWFGHSSVLIKIEGKVILVDPVFSERASMFNFMGPKRYAYSNHVTVDDLPPVDLVIISHDHYDHLDYETISQLKEKVSNYFVPLGVAAHLEHWGISDEQIKEFDWWEENNSFEGLQLVFTPSRHFSGRAFADRFNTLWGSWVFIGKKQRIYFSGDSGYFPGFKEIGDKYGPFDITMLECGQYNKRWEAIHMMPEQTLQAHLDLKGKLLMPIHWGKFTLSLHGWKDPVERLTKAALTENVEVLTPVAGDCMVVYADLPSGWWWQDYR